MWGNESYLYLGWISNSKCQVNRCIPLLNEGNTHFNLLVGRSLEFEFCFLNNKDMFLEEDFIWPPPPPLGTGNTSTHICLCGCGRFITSNLGKMWIKTRLKKNSLKKCHHSLSCWAVKEEVLYNIIIRTSSRCNISIAPCLHR